MPARSDQFTPNLFETESKMNKTQQIMTKYQDFEETRNYRLEGGKGEGVFKNKRNTI